MIRRISPFLRASATSTLLDVATGSADIPLAVFARSRRQKVHADITALDISPDILAEARRYVGDSPVKLVQGDARHLPYSNRSFDLVISSLALHHFDPDDVRAVLSEMWRVTRVAVIVVDLRRSYPAYLATWLATRTVARNRVTRSDGPLSVLRAYTPMELYDLAVSAGLTDLTQYRHLFRHSLVARKPGADDG